MSARLVNIFCATFFLLLFTAIQGSQEIPSESCSLVRIIDSDIFRGAERCRMNCELTAYCPEACCNSVIVSGGGVSRVDNWAGRIAAGDVTIEQLSRAGIGIAAVDRSVIPYGSVIRYNGRMYAALDCGGQIKGLRMDICVPTHAEANLFGRRKGQTVEVIIPQNPSLALKEIIGRAEAAQR